MPIKVVPLGAGQDVGRSCILVSMGGKNIMLDCGMHMGYNDNRRFPDFGYIKRQGPYTDIVDAVIISHFHLDHCGAIAYFSEMCGYDGPIYMTHPTKAIVPILLEDYRKITVEKKGESNFFTSQQIKDCMRKVIAVNLHETVRVDDLIEIKAYYAGHVLGAAMFHVRVGSESIVYTGDFNMTPDRHLGAAWIDKCRPDLLITESTYATTIRDSKRTRESDFLRKIHECVERGGKVLIPVFALGRAQELCILVETYWERLGLNVPIYFSAGLTQKANNYYKLFITWTNQKIKRTFVERNMFEFKHIKPFERAYMDNPGPMVLFASPGMLHAGMSLDVFKKWAPSEKNMVIMPGYCVAGTVGNKVLAGQKQIEMPDRSRTLIDVRLSVENLSFSAHADAKGIVQLIRYAEPRNVMLVHGEKAKMAFLKEKIVQEIGIPCFDPPNGHTVCISTEDNRVPIEVSVRLLKKRGAVDGKELRAEEVEEYAKDDASKHRESLQQNSSRSTLHALLGSTIDSGYKRLGNEADNSISEKRFRDNSMDSDSVEGLLVMEDDQPVRLYDYNDIPSELGVGSNEIVFHHSVPFEYSVGMSCSQLLDKIYSVIGSKYPSYDKKQSILPTKTGESVGIVSICDDNCKVFVYSHDVQISWTASNETLGESIANLVAELCL